jgi:hypothetical protein
VNRLGRPRIAKIMFGYSIQRDTMRITHPALITASVLAVLAMTPALARQGGDREPAGGAFMTSYPEQGSTGIQRGGPPRSVDIPRDYDRPESARPAPRGPWGRYPR